MYVTKHRPFGRPVVHTSLFDDAFLRPFFGSTVHGNWSTQPAVNVRENETGFTIEVAAPGFEKTDFQVKREKETLVISGEKKAEANDSNEKFTRREFRYGKFERKFQLPENADVEKINATYTHGVLHVSIAKKVSVQAEAERTIEIH